jgi:hypothetical protein
LTRGTSHQPAPLICPQGKAASRRFWRRLSGRYVDLITESSIEGECEGFDSHRVFELVNGQEWQQTDYRYKYRYRYRPSARIWRDASGDYIELEGMDELVRVRRV